MLGKFSIPAPLNFIAAKELLARVGELHGTHPKCSVPGSPEIFAWTQCRVLGRRL